MFYRWGIVRRLSLKKLPVQAFIQVRALSGADAVNALRPFYFAVHPDFFGQHPREREVNENSLKRLNGYLENLQKPGFSSFKPTQLTFYVREREQNPSNVQESFGTSGFRAVSFTLQTRDLLSTVLDVLNSCSLSTEHVQSLYGNVETLPNQGAQRAFQRPIRWDKTYYSFTGFKDPEEELEQAQRMETTLSSWLDNNEESAVKKLKNSLPLRKELDRLKDESHNVSNCKACQCFTPKARENQASKLKAALWEQALKVSNSLSNLSSGLEKFAKLSSLDPSTLAPRLAHLNQL